jgi:peptidoglycan/xylan/chitin deacetylase (PgdA/CDA1 family)
MAMAPERLEAQLELLVERGYRAATFTDAVRRPPARRTVAITFDDGLRSVAQLALPILARHGFVGTVFAPTGHIGRDDPVDWPTVDRWIGGPHEHELAPMSWSELALLAGEGWEIASHTCTHPHLTTLSGEDLDHELRASRRAIEERLGQPCTSLAYPYGEADRRVMAAARRAGYAAAAALPERIHRRHHLRWPRVGVWHNDPAELFEAKLSPLGRRRLDFRTGRTATPRWRFDTP